MGVMAYILVPMMAGLMALSRPIVKLMYERGDFTPFATDITSKALFFFSIGMIGYGVYTILSRAYYANMDGKMPLISGACSIVVNFVLCALLVGPMDVGGLALASAVSSIVSAFIIMIPMRKKGNGFLSKEFLKNLLKIIIAALAMTAAVVASSSYIAATVKTGRIGELLAVIAPTAIGIILYLALTRLMGLKEAKMAFAYGEKAMKRLMKK